MLESIQYASFNRRIVACTIDLMLLIMIIMPITQLLYKIKIQQNSLESLLLALISSSNGLFSLSLFLQQKQLLILYIFIQLFQFIIMIGVIMWFWIKKGATPGKIITKCIIVDNKTGNKPTTKQYLLRMTGYLITCILLFIPIVIIGFNKKKRGLHDFIADTSVIMRNNS